MIGPVISTGFTTSAGRTTAGGAHLLGVFQKVGMAFHDIVQRESMMFQLATRRQLGQCLLDAQVANGRYRALGQQGVILLMRGK